MTKFLDYEGLKIFATKLKILISAAASAAEKAASSATTANAAAATAQNRADLAYSLAEDAQSTADDAMPKSGGAFTGSITFGNSSSTGIIIGNGKVQAAGFVLGTMTPVFASNAVLMGDGTNKRIGASNGIAGLDENGYVPLSQLGNLDTTLFEVVDSRPTELGKIKKHIYLVKDLTGANNQYTEWIYTGGIASSDTYDASKWEKLGNFSASIDLSGYQTTAEAAKTFNKSISTTYIRINLLKGNGNLLAQVQLDAASTSSAGLMTSAMVTKLNGIAAGANAYSLPTASSTVLGGVKVGSNLVISSGVLNVEKISDTEINALFT